MLKSELLPARFKKQYEDTIELCLAKIRPLFKNLKKQRVHGDCHLGNILYRDEVPYFVDFDDFVMGPPVQDFWLLFPTRDEEQKIQFDIFLEAYETINSFDRETLKLIEPLRTLRMINYTAWLTKRIEDPVFKQSFPHFGGDQYWQEHIQDLAAQMPFLNQL
jgi:Ser/Thr protein kinase RdoA (MazF antagonist)